MEFFTPSAWDRSAEAITFLPKKSAIGSAVAPGSKVKKVKAKKKSNKKKNKINKKSELSGNEEPTSKSQSSAQLSSTKLNLKIKTGRIEKPKKLKNKKQLPLTPALAKAVNETSTNSLLDSLKEKLKGGRFRFLNEQLYTMDSSKAVKLFEDDRDAFSAYHDGYRHQVEKWPLNPLKRIIKLIRRLPKSLEIADFGCGEGKLAQSVPNKVYSMDLVSTRDDIIACDMTASPLKTQSLDIAVYCLSLMSTNLKDILLEANRVLKMNGHVYIAEIQSRFDDVWHFVRFMEACGFYQIKRDESAKLFYFFHFKKVRDVGKVAVVPDFSLKPCVYRKR